MWCIGLTGGDAGQFFLLLFFTIPLLLLPTTILLESIMKRFLRQNLTCLLHLGLTEAKDRLKKYPLKKTYEKANFRTSFAGPLQELLLLSEKDDQLYEYLIVKASTFPD